MSRTVLLECCMFIHNLYKTDHGLKYYVCKDFGLIPLNWSENRIKTLYNHNYYLEILSFIQINNQNSRDFNGLIWILLSEAAIHWQPSKEEFWKKSSTIHGKAPVLEFLFFSFILTFQKRESSRGIFSRRVSAKTF